MLKRNKYISIQEPNIVNILAQNVKQRIEDNKNKKNINIFCIGTNKCLWDSLGPLTGSMLKNYPELNSVKIIGTMDNTAHAMNINQRLMEVDKDALVIAIDACVGKNIKTIGVSDKPIKPGNALGKYISAVGDLSVLGILFSNNDLSMLMTDELHVGEKLRAEIYMSARIISQSLLKAIIE